MSFYTILHDNTSTIADLSLLLKDFTTSPTSLALQSIDYLYVGYEKKFGQFFIELKPFNIVTGTMNFQYYNGTSWVTLTTIDESQNFFNSGFIYFDRPEDWKAIDVSGIEKFYIRMQPSASHDAGTMVHGLGILLSNDLDIEGIKSNIVSKLNSGNSWIAKHEAARKMIIQSLRNLGYRTHESTEGTNNPVFGTSVTSFKDLTEFDLLEPFELREASKFLTLSMIYLNELSDEQDDKWERSGIRYQKKAEEAVNLFMLKIDSNNTGEEDADETLGNTGINLSWA